MRFTRRLGVKPSVAAELIERVSHRGRQTLRLLLDKDVNWKRETTREGRPEQDGGEGRKGGPAVLDPIPEELFTRVSQRKGRKPDCRHHCLYSTCVALALRRRCSRPFSWLSGLWW